MKRFAHLVVFATGLSLFSGPAIAQTRDHLQCFKIKDSAAKAEYTANLVAENLALPPMQAGCTVIVKPSCEVALSCFLFAEIAGRYLPPGVFNFLSGSRPGRAAPRIRCSSATLCALCVATTTFRAYAPSAARCAAARSRQPPWRMPTC